MSPELWTTEQVADALKYEIQYVRYLIRAGKLRALKAGRTYRVRPEWVDEYIESMEAA